MGMGLQNGKLVKLPTVEAAKYECGECGACCRYTGLPPFSPTTHPEDKERVENLSDAAGQSLLDYYMALKAGTVEDRLRMVGRPNPATDIPCLWYDQETKRCQHYDHRPEACRRFKVGGMACEATRKAYGISEKGEP